MLDVSIGLDEPAGKVLTMGPPMPFREERADLLGDALTSQLARRCLRSAWMEVRRKYPFNINAVCLLPDHLHCLWSLPGDDADYSKRWKAIKGIFSRSYLEAGGIEGRRNRSRRRSGEAAVWQKRFWEHTIRDDRDYQRHLDYIHYNPTKHGLVSRPIDWAWSSFRQYVRQGLYHQEWGSSEPVTVSGFDCVGE